MTNNVEFIAILGGRILLCAIFLTSGFGKIGSFEGTQAYMASKGMFWTPFFLVMAILFELGGGLSVLSGFKARWGALALIVFLIPATLIFHGFWTYEGAEVRMQQIHFLKNLAILGGLLAVVGNGAGPLSVDGYLAGKKSRGPRPA